jgi:hypothetical protein
VIVFYTNNINDEVENGFSIAAGGGSIHDDDSHNYKLVIPENRVAYNTLDRITMRTNEIERNNNRNDSSNHIASMIMIFRGVLPSIR